jgi:lipopolysaccharide/colanic/teichoic acid biosynthesis glycosyltransferase
VISKAAHQESPKTQQVVSSPTRPIRDDLPQIISLAQDRWSALMRALEATNRDLANDIRTRAEGELINLESPGELRSVDRLIIQWRLLAQLFGVEESTTPRESLRALWDEFDLVIYNLVGAVIDAVAMDLIYMFGSAQPYLFRHLGKLRYKMIVNDDVVDFLFKNGLLKTRKAIEELLIVNSVEVFNDRKQYFALAEEMPADIFVLIQKIDEGMEAFFMKLFTKAGMKPVAPYVPVEGNIFYKSFWNADDNLQKEGGPARISLRNGAGLIDKSAIGAILRMDAKQVENVLIQSSLGGNIWFGSVEYLMFGAFFYLMLLFMVEKDKFKAEDLPRGESLVSHYLDRLLHYYNAQDSSSINAVKSAHYFDVVDRLISTIGEKEVLQTLLSGHPVFIQEKLGVKSYEMLASLDKHTKEGYIAGISTIAQWIIDKYRVINQFSPDRLYEITRRIDRIVSVLDEAIKNDDLQTIDWIMTDLNNKLEGHESASSSILDKASNLFAVIRSEEMLEYFNNPHPKLRKKIEGIQRAIEVDLTRSWESEDVQTYGLVTKAIAFRFAGLIWRIEHKEIDPVEIGSEIIVEAGKILRDEINVVRSVAYRNPTMIRNVLIKMNAAQLNELHKGVVDQKIPRHILRQSAVASRRSGGEFVYHLQDQLKRIRLETLSVFRQQRRVDVFKMLSSVSGLEQYKKFVQKALIRLLFDLYDKTKELRKENYSKDAAFDLVFFLEDKDVGIIVRNIAQAATFYLVDMKMDVLEDIASKRLIEQNEFLAKIDFETLKDETIELRIMWEASRRKNALGSLRREWKDVFGVLFGNNNVFIEMFEKSFEQELLALVQKKGMLYSAKERKEIRRQAMERGENGRASSPVEKQQLLVSRRSILGMFAAGLLAMLAPAKEIHAKIEYDGGDWAFEDVERFTILTNIIFMHLDEQDKKVFLRTEVDAILQKKNPQEYYDQLSKEFKMPKFKNMHSATIVVTFDDGRQQRLIVIHPEAFENNAHFLVDLNHEYQMLLNWLQGVITQKDTQNKAEIKGGERALKILDRIIANKKFSLDFRSELKKYREETEEDLLTWRKASSMEQPKKRLENKKKSSSPIFRRERFDLKTYQPFAKPNNFKHIAVGASYEIDTGLEAKEAIIKYVLLAGVENTLEMIEHNRDSYLEFGHLKITEYVDKRLFSFMSDHEEIILTGGYCGYCHSMMFRKIIENTWLASSKRVVHFPKDAIFGGKIELNYQYLQFTHYYRILVDSKMGYAVFQEGALIFSNSKVPQVILNIWDVLPFSILGVAEGNKGSSPISDDNTDKKYPGLRMEHIVGVLSAVAQSREGRQGELPLKYIVQWRGPPETSQEILITYAKVRTHPHSIFSEIITIELHENVTVEKILSVLLRQNDFPDDIRHALQALAGRYRDNTVQRETSSEHGRASVGAVISMTVFFTLFSAIPSQVSKVLVVAVSAVSAIYSISRIGQKLWDQQDKEHYKYGIIFGILISVFLMINEGLPRDKFSTVRENDKQGIHLPSYKGRNYEDWLNDAKVWAENGSFVAANHAELKGRLLQIVEVDLDQWLNASTDAFDFYYSLETRLKILSLLYNDEIKDQQSMSNIQALIDRIVGLMLKDTSFEDLTGLERVYLKQKYSKALGEIAENIPVWFLPGTPMPAEYRVPYSGASVQASSSVKKNGRTKDQKRQIPSDFGENEAQASLFLHWIDRVLAAQYEIKHLTIEINQSKRLQEYDRQVLLTYVHSIRDSYKGFMRVKSDLVKATVVERKRLARSLDILIDKTQHFSGKYFKMAGGGVILTVDDLKNAARQWRKEFYYSRAEVNDISREKNPNAKPESEQSSSPIDIHTRMTSNGELLIYKKKNVVLLTGANGVGKSTFAILADRRSTDWQVLSDRATTISLSNENQRLYLMGESQDGVSSLYSRHFDRVRIRPHEGWKFLKIDLIVSFDNYFLKDVWPILSLKGEYLFDDLKTSFVLVNRKLNKISETGRFLQAIEQRFYASELDQFKRSQITTVEYDEDNSHGHASSPVVGKITAILLLPLVVAGIAMLAALVKLVDRGPAFFRQRRSGYDGVAFDMWKIETMYTEILTGKRKTTSFGRIMRALGADEITQIFSIITGQMVWFGPRPIELHKFNPAIRKFINHHGLSEIRPGIFTKFGIRKKTLDLLYAFSQLRILFIARWSRKEYERRLAEFLTIKRASPKEVLELYFSVDDVQTDSEVTQMIKKEIENLGEDSNVSAVPVITEDQVLKNNNHSASSPVADNYEHSQELPILRLLDEKIFSRLMPVISGIPTKISYYSVYVEDHGSVKVVGNLKHSRTDRILFVLPLHGTVDEPRTVYLGIGGPTGDLNELIGKEPARALKKDWFVKTLFPMLESLGFHRARINLFDEISLPTLSSLGFVFIGGSGRVMEKTLGSDSESASDSSSPVEAFGNRWAGSNVPVFGVRSSVFSTRNHLASIDTPALDVIYSPVGWGNRNVWMLLMHVKYRWDVYPVMIFRKFIFLEKEYERFRLRVAIPLIFVKTNFGFPVKEEAITNLEQTFADSLLSKIDVLSREVVLLKSQENISPRASFMTAGSSAASLPLFSFVPFVLQVGRGVGRPYFPNYIFIFPRFVMPTNARFVFHGIRLTPPSSQHLVKYIYLTSESIVVPLKEIRRIRYDQKSFARRRSHALLEWIRAKANSVNNYAAYQSLTEMPVFGFLEESTMVPQGLLSPL